MVLFLKIDHKKIISTVLLMIVLGYCTQISRGSQDLYILLYHSPNGIRFSPKNGQTADRVGRSEPNS